MARRKSRAGTTRRVCLHRRRRTTKSVSPVVWNVGDLVRFCSDWRPDLIPAENPHGEVIALGLFAVTVRFFAFPDEPIYLGANEIKKATGTRTKDERDERKKSWKKKSGFEYF